MTSTIRHTNLEHLLTVYIEYMTGVNEALFAKRVKAKNKPSKGNSKVKNE